MRRILLSIAASCALVYSAQAQLMGIFGDYGSRVAYAPMGAQFLGSQLVSSGALLNSSGGTIADGCQGIMAARLRGMMSAADSGYVTMLNGQLFSNNDVVSSESVPGVNFVIDNAAYGARNGSGRFNLNNAAVTGGFNATAPYASATSPFQNDTWMTLEWSWNTCGANRYQAAYVNGVQILSAADANGPLTINYAYSGGFLIGDSTGANSLGGLAFYDADDIWIDFTHSVVNYNSGAPNIASGDLAKFYNGAPVRFNSSGNCSDPYGYQPTICFTTDGNTFTTNRGYGGAFTAGGTAFVPTGIPPAGLPANTVGQKWQNFSAGLAAATSFTTASYTHPIAAGDLLVLSALVYGTTSSEAVPCPAGWNTLYSSFNPGTIDSNPETFTVCYAIAGASETGSYTVSWTSSHGYAWMLAEYTGNDTSAPIDVYASSINVQKITAAASANLATSYPNGLYVGYKFYPNTINGPFTTPSPAYIRSNGYLFSSGGHPGIMAFDYPIATPGQTSVGAGASTTAGTSQAFAFAIKPAGSTQIGSTHGAFTVPITAGNGSWRVPPGVTSLSKAQCWGSGAAGARSSPYEPGGAGGGYSESDSLAVTPGQLVYYHVGAGGVTALGAVATTAGDSTWINVSANAAPTATSQGCLATGALAVTASASGLAGNAAGNQTGMVGTITYAGGAGGVSNSSAGSGGGSGAGPTSNGVAGAGTTTATPGAGGVGGGGSGGAGATTTAAGVNGSIPGGGGGGGSGSGNQYGGYGGAGQAAWTW